jgi:hypothetical protein
LKTVISNSTAVINIRPGVSILSVLRHLNYRTWFALAEFVDNSLQSYLEHKAELEKVEGTSFKLKVEIDLDPTDGGIIIVRDNAAGIYEKDYARAFRPAEVPPNQSGLCEFGMGMKSAACWFSSQWIVRTSALGEPVERVVEFDINKIVEDNLEELSVKTIPAKENLHFTEIKLIHLNKIPQGKTLSKIKEHLASIYRNFIRDGLLDLWFCNELLEFSNTAVLIAPHYKDTDGEPKVWRKEIDFDFGLGLRAYGFAALRETASVSTAGFALFRRGRLVEGSADEAYRPEYIFKKSNSYTYQRLFGELHLEGFDVSHTKDGFRWEENEEVFLELLKDELEKDHLPLLDQAEGYRVRVKSDAFKKEADKATQKTADVVEKEIPPVIEKQIDEKPEAKTPPEELSPIQSSTASREIEIELHGCKWKIFLELSNDPSISDWVSVSEKDEATSSDNEGIRYIGVRLSLAHPFTERFCGTDGSQIELLLRIAVAIGLAEIAARVGGVKYAGMIRKNINEILRDALSKP